jgi:hypothetical protein
MHLRNTQIKIGDGTSLTLLCDVHTVKDEIDKGTVEKYTELLRGESKLCFSLGVSF